MEKKTETKKTWRFLLTFSDGRTEERAVEARDFSAAIFSLPRFADSGRYNYKLLSSR